MVRHGSSLGNVLGAKQSLEHCSVHRELTPPGQGDTDSSPSGVIELYPEEKPGVRSAMGFGLGLGVASELYREQESLGREHKKLCQAERGPAEQSGGSGCGLEHLPPETPQGLLSWHQSHQNLGFSSCVAEGPQWGLRATGCRVEQMRRWGHGFLPHFP